MNMKPINRRLREYRAFMIPSSVFVLYLLYHHVHGFKGNVNLAALSKIIQYFDDNVQPQKNAGTAAQYAIAIIVPQDHCTEEGSDIQTVFSREDATNVRNHLNNGDKCVLCTPSKNVIAARPTIKKPKKHAEHILLYPLGNSPMDKLLAQTDPNSCIVFYSYNSPCVTKCIQSKDSILDGLINWKNKRTEAMNVFVFKKIWQKDAQRKDLAKEFQKIDEKVPLYRCNKTDVMGCNKCVENNEKMAPFCLSD